MTSAQWVEYHDATKRKTYNALPTSDITAETVTVDGFAISQADNAGESTSTSRPLAIQLNGTWYPAPTRLASQGARSQVCSRLGVWLLKSQPAYGWDLTKNICELYGTSGYIATDYTYSPYGAVTSSGNVTQPIQWSSEYHDAELGLVYYNYRYYNPLEGRWMGRDLITIFNQYAFCQNSALVFTDNIGMSFQYANIAMTKITKTYDKKGYYKDAAGSAYTKFPSCNIKKYKKKEKHCIKTTNAQYIGKITLYKSWNLKKDYSRAYFYDRKYKTVLEHEFNHVYITSRQWDIFVKTSKLFEGCYCTEKCASLAGGIIRLYHVYYQALSDIENNEFDMNEYGYKLDDDDEIRKGLNKKRFYAISIMKQFEQKINRYLYDLEKCT